MQIIDTSRTIHSSLAAALKRERCRLFAFDFAFGISKNAFLRNSAQSAVLVGVEVRIPRIQRYEARVENAIGAKTAQSDLSTSGNPDSMYRAIRNGKGEEHEVKQKVKNMR